MNTDKGSTVPDRLYFDDSYDSFEKRQCAIISDALNSLFHGDAGGKLDIEYKDGTIMHVTVSFNRGEGND